MPAQERSQDESKGLFNGFWSLQTFTLDNDNELGLLQKNKTKRSLLEMYQRGLAELACSFVFS